MHWRLIGLWNYFLIRYWSETWCLALQEEQWLRIKIQDNWEHGTEENIWTYGTQVIEYWTKIHNEISNLNPTVCIKFHLGDKIKEKFPTFCGNRMRITEHILLRRLTVSWAIWIQYTSWHFNMKNWADIDPVYAYTHNFNRNPIFDVSWDTVIFCYVQKEEKHGLNLQWLAGRNDMNKWKGTRFLAWTWVCCFHCSNAGKEPTCVVV